MGEFIGTAVDLIDRYYISLYVACGVVILVYLGAFFRAGRERAATIFSLEREISAQKQARALWAISGLLAVMVVIAALRLYLIPSIDFEEIVESTPSTPFAFFPTVETPTLTPTQPLPTATPTPRPTLRRSSPTPTLEPTPLPAPACPNVNASLLYPFPGMTVSGIVEIRGSANIDGFQFYKIEYGIGDKPDHWSSIGDTHGARVADGVLGTWDTSSFPNGVYVIRLTVVDVSGNFPAPCEISVVLSN